MAAIEVPELCPLCKKTFTHGEKVTYVSGATVLRRRVVVEAMKGRREVPVASSGKVLLRRHGGEGSKVAIHDDCWRNARLGFFNAAAVEKNMKTLTKLVKVAREETGKK